MCYYLLTMHGENRNIHDVQTLINMKQLTPESSRSWETKRGSFKAATLPVTPTRTLNVPEVFNKSLFKLDMWSSCCLSAYCQKKNKKLPRSCDTSVNIHLANRGRARLTFVPPARARLRTGRWRARTFEEYSG